MDEKQANALFGAFFRATGKHVNDDPSASQLVGVRYVDKSPIGAVRDPKGRVTHVDSTTVCAITHSELLTDRRAYDRQVKEGVLVRATVQEYLSYLEGAVAAVESTNKPAEVTAKKAAKVKES
jgi:hypothetical protein